MNFPQVLNTACLPVLRRILNVLGRSRLDVRVPALPFLLDAILHIAMPLHPVHTRVELGKIMRHEKYKDVQFNHLNPSFLFYYL